MDKNVVAAVVGLLFLAILIYAPAIWLVYRYVKFRSFIRLLYGLTAPPLFLVLLVINIAVILRFWPAGQQILQQANLNRDRVKMFAVLVLFCLFPVVGSWLWYRFFALLNRLVDLDPPISKPDEF